MTKELADKAHEVRMLELEVQELELNARITQLEAEQLIDEECVGCCKVVDVAANLQKELDECVDMNSELVDRNHRITVEITSLREQIKTQATTIEYLKETLKLERIDHMAERKAVNRKYCDAIRKQKAIVEELRAELKKTNHEKDVALTGYQMQSDEMHKEIEGLKDELDECKKIGCHNVGVLKNIIDGLEAKIKSIRNGWLLSCDDVQALEAELSARKEDSEVLMKVVEIIKDESVDNNKAANLIANVVGYFDAPEGPEDTPIDELKQDSKVLRQVCEIVRDDTVGCSKALSQIGNLLTDHLGAPEGPPDATVSMKNRTSVTFAWLELP